jgi:hypothetical protein
MASIILTVASVNNANLTSTRVESFDSDTMYGVMANQNTQTTLATITNTAPATCGGASSWALYGIKNGTYYVGTIIDGSKYWVKIYDNSNLTHVIASGYRATDTGVVILTPENESGINGTVTVTTLVDDMASTNTLVISNYTATKDLELAGSTQFVVIDTNNRTTKYTVSETVAEIADLVNGSVFFVGANVGVAGSNAVASETGSPAYRRTSLTGISISATITNGVAEAITGTIYTFPEGFIRIHDITTNLLAVCPLSTDTTSIAVGTVAANAAAGLTGTEVDILAAADLVLAAAPGTASQRSLACTTTTVFDGTAAAKVAILNCAIKSSTWAVTGGASTTTTVTITGDVIITWSYLGDD